MRKNRQGLRLHSKADAIADDIKCRCHGERPGRSDGARRNGGNRPGLQHHPFSSRRGRAQGADGQSPHAPARYRRDPLRRFDYVEPQHLPHGERRAQRGIHAREQIMETAGPMLEAGVQDLDYGDGKIFLKDQPQQALPIGEVVKRKLGIHGVVRGDALHLRNRQGPRPGNRPQRSCVGLLHVRHPSR